MENGELRHANTNSEPATILESITDAFFALDHQWRFTYVNSEAERVLQRSREELLGNKVWDEFPEAVGSTFYTEYHRAAEGQVTVAFEEYYPPLETWFEVKAYPSEVGLTVYFRDINQRKRAEEKLRGNEERLRAVLVQYGSDIITIVDAEGKILYESPASKRVLGYEPEELIGTNAFDRIHPEDLEQAINDFVGISNNPGLGEPVETRFRHADGSWRYFEVLSNNLLDDPEVRGVVINSRDITRRKQAETRLHERSEAIEASVDGISITDLERGHTYINQAHATMYGYGRPEELLGKNWKVLYDEEQIRCLEQRAMPELEKTGHWRGEAVGKKRDGSTFEQEVSLTTIDDNRVVCVVRDITERKETEKALRQSQATLYEAQRVANIGSWEYYPREDLASWSDQTYLIFGLSPGDQTPTYKRFLEFVYPDDRTVLNTALQESMGDETPQSVDFRIVRIDSEMRWVNAQYEMVYDEAGKPQRAVGTLHDITERKQAEERLREREASLAEAQRLAHLGSWEAEPARTDLGITDHGMRWSDETFRIFGYAPQEFAPTFKDLVRATHPEDREYVKQTMRDSASRGEGSLIVEHRIIHPDGEVRFVQARIEMIYGPEGELVHNFGTILDVTERKRAEEAQARLAAIVESSRDAIIGKTLDGIIKSWNAGAEKLYGYSAKEIVGQHISILTPPDLSDDIPEILKRISQGNSVENRETIRIGKNGEWLEISLTASPIMSPDGDIIGASSIARDITGRKALERQLEYQAFHDTLTGLPNRALFEDRLQHALARIDRREEYIALLFMDLDDFKTINDSLGHLAGDQLLVATARRLEKILRSEDTVARFSGDEFVILLEGAERAGESILVAERVIEALRLPFVLGDREVSTTTSIGISYGLSSQDKAEELLRRADVAMYEAKTEGKGGYRVFKQEMSTRAEERQALGNALRQALAREEFVLHYQPKIEIETGDVIGSEALVRWNHPERGLVLPAKFIPLAEETGLIVSIGRWVFNEACRQAKVWHERYPADPPHIMCVNVPAREFQNPDLIEEMAESIRETGVDPANMELEITESTLMRYGEVTLSKLREIRDMGVKIAIDDFGTGYSSLSYLQSLPADYLKIDRSFVHELNQRPESKVVISAIISLAQSLGIKTVAEGVENAEQLSQLKEMGCDIAQGYYFAKPQPAEEVEPMLKGSYSF